MRTDFRVGDLVSCGYSFEAVTPVEGRVIELLRRSDGKPFLMVEILTGPKQGTRTWPDEAWELGVGPSDGVCEQCGRRFRSRAGEGAYACHRCLHLDEIQAAQRAADPDRRSSSWQRRERARRLQAAHERGEASS
jgi:ribosomal protein L37AE/L43A